MQIHHISNEEIIEVALAFKISAQEAYNAIRQDNKKLNLKRRMVLDSMITEKQGTENA